MAGIQTCALYCERVESKLPCCQFAFKESLVINYNIDTSKLAEWFIYSQRHEMLSFSSCQPLITKYNIVTTTFSLHVDKLSRLCSD